MAGRVLTGDRSVVKTFGIDACWENTFRPNWSFMRLFAPSCRLEKTDTLPNLMEVYAPFSRGRVFSQLTATSQGVIERPFCRLSSQPVIFQLTLVTPFKKAHSLGTLYRVAPAREKKQNYQECDTIRNTCRVLKGNSKDIKSGMIAKIMLETNEKYFYRVISFEMLHYVACWKWTKKWTI